MKYVSLPAVWPSKTVKYCDFLAKLTGRLPREIVKTALAEESSGEKIGSGRTPILTLLRHFTSSPWRVFFQKHRWAVDVAINMLDLAMKQKCYDFVSPADAAQAYCLTARRWMGSIANEPQFLDPEVIADVIRRERRLPNARGLPNRDMVTKSPGWHEQSAKVIERFSAGRPIAALRGLTDHSRTDPNKAVFCPGSGKFKHARPAKDATDPYWLITHSIWETVEDAIASGEPLARNDARVALIVLFQALLGMVEDDVQSIRIGDSGGPLSVYPMERRMILHIGSDYYPEAKCFYRSDLTLPLPEELAMLLEISGIEGTGRLLDLWTSSGWRDAKATMRAKAQTWGFATKPKEWSAHRVHREVAILHLRQSVAEVSLIEGRPILGYRGPCSYLSVSGEEALRLFFTTYHRTRELMGLPRRELPDVPMDFSIFHGKKAASFQALVDRLHADVQKACTHNEGLACIERLMRLLGLRKSAIHVNPARYARRFPERMLLATDKRVGESSFPHWVWLSDELWKLIDTLDARLGHQQWLLPYMQGENFVSSDQLKRESLLMVSGIVDDHTCARAARVAHRKALRELGAGDDVCCLMQGHAPICSPLDYERPDSHAMMCAASRHFSMKLFEKYGFNELATLLAQKLEKYLLPPVGNSNLAKSKEVPERFLPPPARERSLALWTECEDKVFTELSKKIQRLSKFPANEKAQRTLLLVITAVECGIPPSYLLRYGHYYSLGNFLRSKAAGKTWFQAITGDCDAGGLSRYRIILEDGEDSTLQRFVFGSLRAPRGEGDRGCRRGMGWRLFQGVTPKDIGRCVRKLLYGQATDSEMSSQEAVEVLEKCSRVRSRYLLPGYVAGVMAGALREVLNHFNPADVIRYRDEAPDFCLLDGTPFDKAAATAARMSKDSLLGTQLEDIAWDHTSNEKSKVQAACDSIHGHGNVMPSKSWVAARFVACRFPSETICRRDKSRSLRISAAIFCEAERRRQLKLSKSLRLPEFAEQACHHQLTQVLKNCRPKGIRKLGPDEQNKLRAHNLFLGVECLALIACLGLRASEAIRVISERNGVTQRAILDTEEALWCAVRGTKSKKAKRVVRGYFSPWPDLLRNLRQSLKTTHSSVLNHTKDRIKNAVESIDASLHLIRHWYVIGTVDQIMSEHYLNGSALLVLESFASNNGHRSLATDFQSYVGTVMNDKIPATKICVVNTP